MKISQIDSVTNIYHKLNTSQNNPSITFGCKEDSFESEFSKNKKRIIENLKKYKIDKNLITQLANSRDNLDFRYSLEDIAAYVLQKYEATLFIQNPLLQNATKTHKTNLALEQYVYKLKEKSNKKLISFFKDISEKDQNPEILKIKKELKTKYNLKDVSFDNNEQIAKMCLDAMKILKKNDMAFPDSIVYNKYFPNAGISFTIDNKKVILINPEMAQEWAQSTNNPLHIIIHECVHYTQPELIAFSVKNIPSEFKNTTNNLSEYAHNNFTHEIHAELVTKKLLDKLNSDEEKLLDYLEK